MENNKIQTLEELFKKHQEFCINTFPNATWVSSLRKLEKEIKEIEKERTSNDYEIWAMEYIDCMMCLLDSMNRIKLDFETFKKLFIKKMEINKKRKWMQNKDGSYSHIK